MLETQDQCRESGASAVPASLAALQVTIARPNQTSQGDFMSLSSLVSTGRDGTHFHYSYQSAL